VLLRQHVDGASHLLVESPVGLVAPSGQPQPKAKSTASRPGDCQSLFDLHARDEHDGIDSDRARRIHDDVRDAFGSQAFAGEKAARSVGRVFEKRLHAIRVHGVDIGEECLFHNRVPIESRGLDPVCFPRIPRRYLEVGGLVVTDVGFEGRAVTGWSAASEGDGTEQCDASGK
jgi:hypothetical protein